MNAATKPAELELMDGTDRRMASKALGGSTARLWILLTTVFLVISLALAIYIIYIKVSEQKESKSRETLIMLQFPGFFRTPIEQTLFEEQYLQVAQNESTHFEVANNTGFENCSFTCPAYPSVRRRRHSQASSHLAHFATMHSVVHALTKRAVPQNKAINHGCCVSRRIFISPETALTLDGKEVKIVRLDKRKQYFISETCEYAKGCTGCTCKQETTITAAVVMPYNQENNVTLDYIQLPGCCKCVNGGSAG